VEAARRSPWWRCFRAERRSWSTGSSPRGHGIKELVGDEIAAAS
jgi:hypothetical protein